MKTILARKLLGGAAWRFVLLGVGLSAFDLSTTAWAQTPKRSRQESSVFTSADHQFQIRYPSKLKVCSHRDGENPDIWSPDECMSEIPVCDSSGHAGNVLMCLAYPGGELRGSEFTAAAFAVSRIENLGAKECSEKWPRSETSDIHREEIGNLKVAAAKARESTGAHIEEQNIYRVYHQKACYELDVNLTTALSSAFAPEDAPRKLSPTERRDINEMLMQALAGFRFLK